MWNLHKSTLNNVEQVLLMFNPRLTKGGGVVTVPSRIFPRRPKTKMKVTWVIKVIYPTSFAVILIKNGYTTLPIARLSPQRPLGRGRCHLSKFKISILKKLSLVWSWNLLCMLEMSYSSFTSQKPGEIPIFWTFLAKFSILTYVLLKIGWVRLCSWHHCDIMRWMFVLILLYIEKEDPTFSFQVHRG